MACSRSALLSALLLALAAGTASAFPAGFSAELSPGEILLPASSIRVRSPIVLELDAVRDALEVLRVQESGETATVPGTVTLAPGGRIAIWTSRNPMSPGRHWFVVREPTALRSPRSGWALRIPFLVTDSKAAIDDGLRIEHLVRLYLVGSRLIRLPPVLPPGEAAPRPYFEIFKLSHRRTDAPETRAFDRNGEPMDLTALLGEIHTARFGASGKIHPDLQAQIDDPALTGAIPVAIWLDVQAALVGVKGVDGYLAKLLELQTAVIGAVDAALQGWWGLPDPAVPVIYALLDKSEIATVAGLADVLGIFPHQTGGVHDETPDYRDMARSLLVHARGAIGTGIRVAVWENAPLQDDGQVVVVESFDALTYVVALLEPVLPTAVYQALVALLDIFGPDGPGRAALETILGEIGIDAGPILTPLEDEHSLLVHAIIRNEESGGHAPGCSLYSANRMLLLALEWAVDEKLCSVVNQSFHRAGEETSAELSFDDMHKDWLAAWKGDLGWTGPRPTIVQAAGNLAHAADGMDTSEYVNHKGYNGLVVGGLSEDGTVAAFSAFRNPASTHGDRELPDLCAQATEIQVLSGHSAALGTSFAAPAVSGVAALVQSTSSGLVGWPEACRAVLLAGARRAKATTTWWLDVAWGVDAAEGGGGVDALRSHRIAVHRRAPGTSSSQGWDAGEITDGDVDATGYWTGSYRIRIPGSILLRWASQVKVVLAWDQSVTAIDTTGAPILPPFLTGELKHDLDLIILDGEGHLVAHSSSFDNSVEIAEFEGWPRHTYTVKIRRWAGTGRAKYGIAWGLRGGVFWSEAAQPVPADPREILRRWHEGLPRRRGE